MRDRLRKFLSEVDQDILCVDGYDDSIIGYTYLNGNYKAAYDMNKMVDICMSKGDMSIEDAIGYLEHNCWTAYHGASTPVFIQIIRDEDINE